MIAESYIPGRGPLYRMDPRAKLVLLIVMTVMFFSADSHFFHAGMLLFAFLVTLFSTGAGNALRPLRAIWPVLLLTAILTPPFTREGPVLLSVGQKMMLTAGGLNAAVSMLLRFAGVTSVFFLFFSTTESSSLILALRSFGLPFRAAMTVTISLRYIPDMFRVYHNISDAHRLRRAGTGQTGNRRGFRTRLDRLFPVLVSVLIYAVRNIPALAMALDTKGFGRRGSRTSCRKLPPVRNIIPDISAAVLVSAVLVLLGKLC